ncbi:MAG TPA: hypothetical protein VI138_03035 [Candidatus Dormibacteraeota bacterium]
MAGPSPAQVAAGASRPAARLRLGEFVWLLLGVVDAFLAVDFLLRAVGAHDSGFVAVVNRVGDWLATPFIGVFQGQGVPRVDHTTFWAALLGIVVYTLAAWFLIRVLRLLAAPTERPDPHV